MNKSESIKELAEALSKAQKDITGAKKDSKNPFFKSNYADLGSVQDACREALTDNGLSVTQLPGNDGENVTIETVLMHSSGEWLSSTFSMRPTKNDPQGLGSCITYARRYALAAVCGVAQVDDDGNQASADPGLTADQKKVLDKALKENNGVGLLYYRSKFGDSVYVNWVNSFANGKKTAYKDLAKNLESEARQLIDSYYEQISEHIDNEDPALFELTGELTPEEKHFVNQKMQPEQIAYIKRQKVAA